MARRHGKPPWAAPPKPNPRQVDDVPEHLQRSIAYWREHPRTPMFNAVADALSPEWRPASEIAAAAGTSYSYARLVLDVLAANEEADRAVQPRETTNGPPWLTDWRYVYKQAAAYRARD